MAHEFGAAPVEVSGELALAVHYLVQGALVEAKLPCKARKRDGWPLAKECGEVVGDCHALKLGLACIQELAATNKYKMNTRTAQIPF